MSCGDSHSRARLPSVSAPPVDQQEARVSASQSQCFHPMEPNSSRLITTISLLSLPAPGLMKLIITQTEHQGRVRKKGGKTTTAAITSVITFYRWVSFHFKRILIHVLKKFCLTVKRTEQPCFDSWFIFFFFFIND